MLELRLPSIAPESLKLLLELLSGASGELLSLESERDGGRVRVSLSLSRGMLVPFLIAFLNLIPSAEIDTLVRLRTPPTGA